RMSRSLGPPRSRSSIPGSTPRTRIWPAASSSERASSAAIRRSTRTATAPRSPGLPRRRSITPSASRAWPTTMPRFFRCRCSTRMALVSMPTLSPAAAETAGLAALLVASGKSNSAASTQIRGATDPIAGQAFGRVNVNKALTTVATAPVPGATPTPTPPPTPPTYVVGAAPTVQNVSSGAADGRYGIGQVIPITVTFDGAVTVTGTPQITLETGAIDAVVNFTSLSGNQKTLTFNYTVAAGQNSPDLDYVSTTAPALNGG